MRETPDTRKWGSGSKLTRLVVDIIRSGGDKQGRRNAFIQYHADANNVHPRTISRILEGSSWKAVEGRVLPGDTKDCEVCGAVFGRHWPNGRRRSDAFWAKKRTCSHHCCVKLAWREGQYDGRRGAQTAKSKAKAEAKANKQQAKAKK